jgi:putative protease
LTAKQKNEVEITAPVGSYEALSAAFRAGADSIYFGVGNLNMRSRSSANFDIEDLAKIAEKCRRLKIKSYLALNTMVYDGELREMREICDAAKASGISAVIASDIAVMEYALSINLPIHVSVQANVCNIESVKFYARYAEAIVLARELTLSQIRNIIEAVKNTPILGPNGKPLRIELFAHGALCVAVSGKCYMSLGMYNASANRGACLQNCRRAYRIIDEETGDELKIENRYVMSPKDICTINVLDQILDSGVSILKIEGRGRSADYVSTVVGVYREAVDSWRSGEFTESMIPAWLERLETVFNRGFWLGGYYLGEKLGEWCGAGGSLARKRKVHLGKVNKYFSNLQVAELLIEAGPLETGQEIMITGVTTGAVSFKVSEIRLEGNPVSKASQGDVISIPVPEKVRHNDKLYLVEERRGLNS